MDVNCYYIMFLCESILSTFSVIWNKQMLILAKYNKYWTNSIDFKFGRNYTLVFYHDAVFDQNMQNIVLISNLELPDQLKITIQFCEILRQFCFRKLNSCLKNQKYWSFWDSAHNMLSLGLGYYRFPSSREEVAFVKCPYITYYIILFATTSYSAYLLAIQLFLIKVKSKIKTKSATTTKQTHKPILFNWLLNVINYQGKQISKDDIIIYSQIAFDERVTFGFNAPGCYLVALFACEAST